MRVPVPPADHLIAPKDDLDNDDLAQRAALLGQLTLLAELDRDICYSLRKHVELARDDGCTWQLIGHALGCTRQQAQQRFRHLSAR